MRYNYRNKITREVYKLIKTKQPGSTGKQEKGALMFKNNKLSSVITQVTDFIKDLEEGIESNKEAIAANQVKATEIKSKATDRGTAIKTIAREKATRIAEKAAVKRDKVTTETADLRAQNDIAAKLLKKLS